MRLILTLCVVVLAIAGCKKDKGAEAQPPSGVHGASSVPAGTQAPSGETAGEAPKKNPEGCNSDFSQEIHADYTLTEKCSPYTLKGDLNVDGYNLTIEPGVELRFADGRTLEVGYNSRAKLIAKGTAEKPVRFTALDHKEAGAWHGIVLDANSEGSTLENVVIEYAGLTDNAALDIKAGGTTLKNVKLTGAKDAAVKISSDKPLAEISGLDLTGAGAAERVLQLPFSGAGALGAGNKFPEKAVILLEPASVEADLKLPAQGVAYRTHGETDVHGKDGKTAVITIDPGVTIELSEDAELDFGYEGDRPAGLKAVGAADKPIRFVRFGDDQKSTPWKVIAFYGAARGPELDYVTFENGGRQDDGTLRFDGARALGKITHCSFTGSHGAAILVKDAKERFAAFDANTFKDNAQAALAIPSELASGLGAGNKFEGDEWIEVKGDVHHDTTWAAVAAPYRVIGDVTVEGAEAGKSASLTIDKGTKLVFGEGASLNVGYNNPGKLAISAVAMKPLQGTWKGIESYAHGNLSLENTSIEGVADDTPAIRADAESEGSVKNVSVKSKLGFKKCSDKVQSSGNKPKETKDGC